MSGGGTFDVWIQSFAPGSDPVPALQQVFGIDERAAIGIQQTIPRAVRRNATREEAEEIAAALRAIGAKVELRGSRGDPRASAAGAPRPTATGSAHASGPGIARPGAEPSSEVPFDSSVVPLPPEPDPSVPEPPPATGLVPLDPMAAGGGALELAFDPADTRTRAPRSVPRASVERVNVAPAPPAIETKPASSMPSISFSPPGWLKGVGVAVFVGVAAFAFRAARCYCRVADAMNATPEEIAAMEAESESEALAGAIEVQAFLARSNAQLGGDMDRNAGLASTLRRQGAVRVLATDIVRMTGIDVARTLVVELPPAPAARRRLAATVEGYYVGDSALRPEDVEPPDADERYLFIELE